MIFLKPFDFVKNCYLKEEVVTSEKGQWESYHPCIRIMTFFPNMIPSMAKVSMLQTGIPDWAIGCVLYHSARKQTYLPKSAKYISAKSVTETESAELEAVKKIYCVGAKHGKQLVQILKQENVNLGEKGKRRKK
jgi:flagellar biosynthesis component FlhA